MSEEEPSLEWCSKHRQFKEDCFGCRRDDELSSLRERLRASELEAGRYREALEKIQTEEIASLRPNANGLLIKKLRGIARTAISTPSSPYAEAVRAVIGAARKIDDILNLRLRYHTEVAEWLNEYYFAVKNALAKLDEAGGG